MSCGLARFKHDPGRYSDESEGLLSVLCEAKYLYLSTEHVILTVYIIFNYVENQWCIDIRYAPRSGDFDMLLSNPLCFSTQPGRGVVGMSWIGDLLISSCITIAFLKRWNMLLHCHTKLNNSQIYFRVIPIDYHDL